MSLRLFCLTVVGCAAFGQQMSLGVVGGFSSTDAFQDRTAVYPPGSSFRSNHAYSDAKDWVAGAALEIRFGDWSVEADAMFRQLHLKQDRIQGDGLPFPIEKYPVVTWEVPVLAKYRLPGRNLRPFLAAGPSFRTAGNTNGTSPSHFGVTAGAGVEMRWGNFRFAPTVRYTRWRRDDRSFEPTLTAPNQVEFLLGISPEAASLWQPLGRHVSIGVILGTNVTDDVDTVSQTIEARPTSVVNATQPGPRNLALGPYVEVYLPWDLSVEADAVHRHISSRSTTTFLGPRPPGVAPECCDNVRNNNIWEFPILLKKSFRFRSVRPFVGAGPTFRRPQGLRSPSPYGAVAAVGAEVRWRKLRISPSLRFSRWAGDRGGDSPVRINQLLFLVGVGL